MAQFPNSPGASLLAGIAPCMATLPASFALARVYYRSSAHPLPWYGFRWNGPLNFRWDHHAPTTAGEPHRQAHAVYYAAADAVTCLAEVFQTTRRIDRVYQAPWLVVFNTQRPLTLLDLTGEFATRIGASMAIHSGSRRRARCWVRDLYHAFPAAEGILYSSPMRGGHPAVALNDRALRAPLFPPHPEFHRALADELLLDPLKHAAQALGYALR